MLWSNPLLARHVGDKAGWSDVYFLPTGDVPLHSTGHQLPGRMENEESTQEELEFPVKSRVRRGLT